MNSLRYLPGDWYALVNDEHIVLLPANTSAEQINGLWTKLAGTTTVEALLSELLSMYQMNIAALPNFALVSRDSAPHLVLRGALEFAAQSAAGVEEISGAGVTTWTERKLGEATSWTLRTGSANLEVAFALPIGSGIVRVSSLSWGTANGSKAGGPADAASTESGAEPQKPTVATPKTAEPDKPAAAPAIAKTAEPAKAPAPAAKPAAVAPAAKPAEPAKAPAPAAKPAAVAPAAKPAEPAKAPAPAAKPAAAPAVKPAAAPAPAAKPAAAAPAAKPAAKPAAAPAVKPAAAPAPAAKPAAAAPAAKPAVKPVVAPATTAAKPAEAPKAPAPATAPEKKAEAPKSASDVLARAARAAKAAKAAEAANAPSYNEDSEITQDPRQYEQEAYSEEFSLAGQLLGARGAAETEYATNDGDDLETIIKPRPAAVAAAYPVESADDEHTIIRGSSVPKTDTSSSLDAKDGTENSVSLNEFILARSCSKQHPNPPTSSTCRECGERLSGQAQQVRKPSMGRMIVSDHGGAREFAHELNRSVILGRQPNAAALKSDKEPRLLQVESPSGDISRSHLCVRVEGWHVQLVDLGATNSTVLLREGQRPRRLSRHQEIMLINGDVADLGDGVSIRFEDLP
ncbi:MAG: FHA domain-containing protein [Glutamicibacter arilaitensis]|uniref:FHA domain-containing protein n=2 Tax=Glutamicibacter arilaitensis TaxID=256701 RepID=UPI003FB78BED